MENPLPRVQHHERQIVRKIGILLNLYQHSRALFHVFQIDNFTPHMYQAARTCGRRNGLADRFNRPGVATIDHPANSR